MWTIEECYRCQRNRKHHWLKCGHKWSEAHIVSRGGSTLLAWLWELARMQHSFQFVRFRLRNTRTNVAILSDIVEISPENSYFLLNPGHQPILRNRRKTG